MWYDRIFLKRARRMEEKKEREKQSIELIDNVWRLLKMYNLTTNGHLGIKKNGDKLIAMCGDF